LEYKFRYCYPNKLIVLSMPNLYIISGCNGAGKTTASFTILPELLNCYEFVNADIIAAGLSPFKPESVALEAGRIMLQRINALLETGVDFAFETTLATRSYVSFIQRAKSNGYTINLLYLWLSSPEFAVDRVFQRVSKGGHNIPNEIVERRYYRGIKNLFNLYIPLCDNWLIAHNMENYPQLIAKGSKFLGNNVINADIWNKIIKQVHDK